MKVLPSQLAYSITTVIGSSTHMPAQENKNIQPKHTVSQDLALNHGIKTYSTSIHKDTAHLHTDRRTHLEQGLHLQSTTNEVAL